jgi:hypothetical protein
MPSRRVKFTVYSLLTIGLLGVAYQLIPQQPVQFPFGKEIIDIHTHVAGIGAGDSGIVVSSDLLEGYKFDIYLKAFGVTYEQLHAEGDRAVLHSLSERVSQSKTVSKAVVLALDGVVENGVLNLDKTQLYVPNEFLVRELPNFPNLLFGASVNPYRTDALQRLDTVKKQGAVLIKWIPAIMDIDPSDKALKPYYRKLVELDLPLLIHVGQERSFGPARDEFGDPVKLNLPLVMGVTVIAAHIATTGESQLEPNFDRILPMFRRYPNLYTEISSLTQINKLGYLSSALQDSDLQDRMLYGTDWPLQFFPLVSPWFQINHVSNDRLKSIQSIKNQWDRDVALKLAMGVPKNVFFRTRQLLKLD